MGSLRHRLKFETRADHKQLDMQLDEVRVAEPGGLSQYLLMWYAQLTRFEPLMAQLGRAAPPSLVDLLLADLAALDCQPGDAEPRNFLLQMHPLGLAYVIAGSHFGAYVLRRRWESSQSKQVLAAGRFLQSNALQQYWPGYVALLRSRRFAAAEEDAIVLTAKRCFQSFGQSFEQVIGQGVRAAADG